jgi:hypothetical protein
MTQGDVRDSFVKICNACFFIIALFLSQTVLATSVSFDTLNEQSALADKCDEVRRQNVEKGLFKDKVTSIGILLHPESLDSGVRHYVPFVRLNFQKTTGAFPLIPDSNKKGKYHLPCNFTQFELSHIPEQAYPTIELLNLTEAELEKLNQEHQVFSLSKEQLQQTQILTNNEFSSHSGEVIAHYFNNLVIAEFPVKWFGNPLSLVDLFSALARHPELAKGKTGNTFKSFNQFDFYLYPNAMKDKNISAEKLAFRISNDYLCPHKVKGCADEMNQTGTLQEQSISTDGVMEESKQVEIKEALTKAKEFTGLYPIKIHLSEKMKNTTFIKVFETEDVCLKDKPNNFSAKGFTQTEALQKLIRYSGASATLLPKDKWIYITDTRTKLTKCSIGKLLNDQIHFQLIKLRSDKPRKLIVWSPRMGFEQKFEKVRAAQVVRETLKAWVNHIYKQQSVFPFTMIIIEPSGAAKVILEGEELTYLPQKDVMEIIESIDTAGHSDRALLDLTSVNSLIKSKFDHVLYIVDSRNEAFKIEDVGVALSWKVAEKLTVANLGECQNWFDILGKSGFSCYSATELSNGLNKVLKDFL